MKDWNKLTYEELASLSDEQIDIYKKLLYAQNGIQFPEKPKEIDDVNIPKDATAYKIDHLGEIMFSSLDEARAVVECLKKCKTICHTKCLGNYSNTYLENGMPLDYYKNPQSFDINTQEFYSKKKMIECQETLDTYRKLREQYDIDKKNYEQVNSKAIEITQEFLDKLYEAKEIIRHRESLARKYYLDYLPLSENKPNIAMSFLKKAYIVSEEDEKYINSHKNNYTKEN